MVMGKAISIPKMTLQDRSQRKSELTFSSYSFTAIHNALFWCRSFCWSSRILTKNGQLYSPPSPESARIVIRSKIRMRVFYWINGDEEITRYLTHGSWFESEKVCELTQCWGCRDERCIPWQTRRERFLVVEQPTDEESQDRPSIPE